MRNVYKVVQDFLSNQYDIGPSDGILGPKTSAALNSELGLQHAEWPVSRKAVYYLQLRLMALSLNPGALDGWWGPKTRAAYRRFMYTGDARMIQTFGEPGDVTLQTYIEPPYRMVLAWDPRVQLRRIGCHQLVADSLHEVLAEVQSLYGDHRIRGLGLDLFGGALHVRKRRGGNEWSEHAFGSAIDIDPENNRLRWGRDNARFATAPYDDWWGVWESRGWTSLGRSLGYDWMHISKRPEDI